MRRIADSQRGWMGLDQAYVDWYLLAMAIPRRTTSHRLSVLSHCCHRCRHSEACTLQALSLQVYACNDFHTKRTVLSAPNVADDVPCTCLQPSSTLRSSPAHNTAVMYATAVHPTIVSSQRHLRRCRSAHRHFQPVLLTPL